MEPFLGISKQIVKITPGHLEFLKSEIISYMLSFISLNLKMKGGESIV